MTISEEILNSRFGSGFNAQFGENLIQDLSENQLEYKEYFEFLFICKDYALPILRNSPETIELIRDMDNMNNVDKLLISILIHIIDPKSISSAEIKKAFQNYVINNKPELQIFNDLTFLKKLVKNKRSRAFYILHKWFNLVQDGKESIYCDDCNAIMIPTFKKVDIYFCSNGSCENSLETYHNICWKCKTTIDSKYNKQCGNCEWYICNKCQSCRDPRYGGCDDQRPIGNVRKYVQYLSLEKISQYIHNIFIKEVDIYNNHSETTGNIEKINCGRGKKILSSEQELNKYLALYLPRHTIKLSCGLEQFDYEELSKKVLNVWDWGCGQGIGSLMFHEKILGVEHDFNISRFVLIDPSKHAVDAGVSMLNDRIKEKGIISPEIHKVIKEFDRLEKLDLSLNSVDANFHILSNILDVEYFSLDKFYELIKMSFTSYNYFLCTGPHYKSNIERTNKFFKKLSKTYQVEVISKNDKTLLTDMLDYKTNKIRKDYVTRYELCFKAVN